MIRVQRLGADPDRHVVFGKRFEGRAECLMHSFVGVYVARGMPPFIRIAKFRIDPCFSIKTKNPTNCITINWVNARVVDGI